MENYEEFYETICRVCLSHSNSGNMVSLTDSSVPDKLSCYGKAVITFANIRIKPDLLPQKICGNCLSLLKQAILFKKTCETSDDRLRILLLKLDGSSSEFKEKVSQYVLFTHNFPNQNPFCMENEAQTSDEGEDFVKDEVLDVPDINSDLDDFYADNFENHSNLDEKEHDSSSEIDATLDCMEKVIEMPIETLNTYRKRYKRKSKKHYNNLQNRRSKSQQGIETDEIDSQNRIYDEDMTTDEAIQCKVCNKMLANRKNYKFHMKRHTDRQYVCEQCAKCFSTYHELQFHLSSTHGVGPHYLCKVCGFKAPRKYDLMEHERIHTGERPYKCDECGLTFRRRFIWTKHAVYHKEKTIPCPQCPRKFYRRSEMLAHSNNVHERVNMYACYECDVTYARPATVRRHLVEKHGIARDMQGRIPLVKIGKSSS